MGIKIAVVSQKGGTGKSTICRALGVTFAANGTDTLIADMDTSQSTTFEWQTDRVQHEGLPPVAVQTFGTAALALRASAKYDLTIFDGAPHATQATAELARAADLIIIPTGISLDDLRPAVRLANDLVSKHGIPETRIGFVFNRIGDSNRELIDARTSMRETPYHLFDVALKDQTAYRRAQDAGLAIVEASSAGPRDKADRLMQAIAERLSNLIK